MSMSKRLIGVVGLFLGMVLAIGICLAAIVWGIGEAFTSGLCGETVFQEVNAPSGQVRAVVYEHDCGATTGFRTYIAILKGSQSPESGQGIVFAADGYPDDFEIDLHWESEQRLIIEYYPEALPDQKVTSMNAIEVQYLEK